MCASCCRVPNVSRRCCLSVNCRIARQIDRQLAKLSPAPLLGLAPGMNFESAHLANCGCSRPRPKKTAERKKTPDENPPHENLRRKSPMTIRREKKSEMNFIHPQVSIHCLHAPYLWNPCLPRRSGAAVSSVQVRQLTSWPQTILPLPTQCLQ